MLDADIFVYPSRIENGCNAVQEAMLLGMPIVCTNSGGMSSTISNKENGVLVQVEDPFHMAGAIIIELIENIDLAIEYGKNAKITAIKRHDKKTITIK